MPLTNRAEAKKGGFAQVREALTKFKGRVTSAEFGQWGGKLVDDDGKPLPPKEYLEVTSEEVEVLEVTEELSMPVTEWNFRINCSDFEGSFWVEKFLESADKFKLLIPDGLVNKIITWEKVTLENTRDSKFNSTNYVIVAVEGGAPAKSTPKVVSKPVTQAVPTPVQAEETQAPPDPLETIKKIAIGKTEAQFRTAIALDPQFSGSPLLSLAKAGMLTQALVNEGKLVLVKQGSKEVYQIPS